MLNRVFLIGRVAQEPTLRYTPEGVPVTRFTLAVNRVFTDSKGERREATDFIDVVVWRKQAEVVARYLNKGRLTFVEGRLQIRSYEDNQGVRRKVAEVVALNVKFLESLRDSRSGSELPAGQQGRLPGTEDAVLEEGDFISEVMFNEDEVPF